MRMPLRKKSKPSKGSKTAKGAGDFGFKFSERNVPGAKVIAENGQFKQMTTVMPDGLEVAWASCGRCSMHVTVCSCQNGILNPSSVEWIYVKELIAKEDPEALKVQH